MLLEKLPKAGTRAEVAPVKTQSPTLPSPKAKRLHSKVTHLFIEVKFPSTFNQCVFAAGQE